MHTLHVFQACERHVQQILNKDEFLRRLTVVLLSNDPVGRALTLRVIGAIAGIVHDRVDVQYRSARSLGLATGVYRPRG